MVVFEKIGEDEVPITSAQKYPPLDPEGGPHTYYPHPKFMKNMERTFKYVGVKFWIQDSYFLVWVNHTESVLTRPVGCVSVYHQNMQMGLRFPYILLSGTSLILISSPLLNCSLTDGFQSMGLCHL